MKIKNKVLFIIMVILLSLVLKTNCSYAALKSNGGTVATHKIGDWLTQIRQMETSGGTLGLTETINSTTLLSTSGSNNLDCHMEKNSEYGAMAILSASSYGNPSKITSGGTTTGNKSGIYININSERVSAGVVANSYQYGLNDLVPIFGTMSGRYRNTYKYDTYSAETYVRNIGDAMGDTLGWHGATNEPINSSVEVPVHNDACVIRAYSGSLFSYNARTTGSNNYYAGANVKTASRAVIVVGEGF